LLTFASRLPKGDDEPKRRAGGTVSREETMEENRNEIYERAPGSNGPFWVVAIAFVILAAAGGFLLYYNYQQRSTISALTSQQAGTNDTISQLQSQLGYTTAKLQEVSAAQAAAEEAAKSAKASGNGASAAAARTEANRLKQLQTNLEEQKQQLQATQDDVSKTRSDLEGNISSTRDELNGSIAKTHDELMLLEKRGERDYFEFDAAKGKNFQRTGPLSISLRKTDQKHSTTDLVVLVNDRQISKSKVGLYEPVWIYPDKDAQPVQVVVNKIDKNSVHGYISAPKYSPSDLAASAAPAAAPATTQAPPPDDQPDQPGNGE
jgi:hypothetical protein